MRSWFMARFATWLILGSALALPLSPLVHADPLWQWQDIGVAVSASVTLPENAVDALPVTLSSAALMALTQGSEFSLTLPDGEEFVYRVEQTSSYPGGDQGLRARLVGEDNLHIVSLTRGAEVVLATLYTPVGKYRLQASRSGADYVGYLFRESDAFKALPYDFLDAQTGAAQADGAKADGAKADAAQGGGQLHEVVTSDVTVTQTFSNFTLLIGEVLDVKVDIANISSSAITGQTLKIIFILDSTDYIDSSAGCAVMTVQYIQGPAQELHCPISNLAPGSTFSIEYSVRMTARALPNVASTVILDEVRQDEFILVANDVLADADNDGISNFNEGLLGTNPNSAASGPAEGASSEIDLLVLYTPKYAREVSSGNPTLEFNQLIQQTNDMYAASNVGLSFRPVAYREVNYTVTTGVEAALEAMQARDAPFQDMDYMRAIAGADLVVLMDGLYVAGDACGIAQGGGFGNKGDLTSESSRGTYTALFMPGAAPNSDSECTVDTLAHELGHLMGLAHSRVEQSEGTFPWALGHGVTGSFRTIMAYDTHFPEAEGLPVFSNPNSSACKGQPCGVPITDEVNGANAVLALNTTRFQIARFHGARPEHALFTASGGQSLARMSGGVIRTGGANGAARQFGNAFSADDPVSLVMNLAVDPAHVGQTGVTHVVLVLAGVGAFQLNSSFGYVPWDGNPANLVGSIQPRALRATEELLAFRDLPFRAIGLSSASITAYFAYTVPGIGELVFTGNGVPLVIQ